MRVPSVSNRSCTELLGAAQVHVDVDMDPRAVDGRGPGNGPEVVEGERLGGVVAADGVEALQPDVSALEDGVGCEERAHEVDLLRRDRGEVVVDEAGQPERRDGEPVEAAGVEPQHVHLHRGGAGGHGGADGVDGPGKGGVMVRVVAAPDDAVLAHERRQGGQRVFVDLEADGALPGEVLRRAQRHVRAEPAEGLRLLVQAFEPERGPASGGLQEEKPQPRVVLERPECDELGAGEHRLERVGDGMEQERVERAVRPERRDGHRTALVDTDGHLELLGRVPHDVVGAVGQGASQAGVGADESGHEAELGDRPTELACRGRRVLQRQHGRPEEPAGIGGAVAREPVVVGGGKGRPPPPDPPAAEKYRPIVGYSTAWSMPSLSMSRRRATGSDPPGWRRPAGGTTPGRRTWSRAGRGCPAARPGPRCRRRRRVRSRADRR